MSETECIAFCPICDRTEVFVFSGSGKKGSCSGCLINLPDETTIEQINGKAISFNG